MIRSHRPGADFFMVAGMRSVTEKKLCCAFCRSYRSAQSARTQNYGIRTYEELCEFAHLVNEEYDTFNTNL